MKYTVITGASSGIGYETALEFAARGKNLIIVARRLDKLEGLKSAIQNINPDLDVIIEHNVSSHNDLGIEIASEHYGKQTRAP